jgi:hypothetical protein
MRAISGGVILFPPDVQGMLGAAALLRKLGPEHDLLALEAHEATRRLYGLSAEPVPRRVFVIDLVPTDSLDSLLVPTLHRFVAAGVRATWIYGRDEPSPLLEELGETITLLSGTTESWRLIVDASNDVDFGELADAIEARAEGPGTIWRMMLEAVSSSWDWQRVYSAVAELARLGVPGPEERAWAVEQLTDLDRALGALERAPVRKMGGLSVAVLGNSLLSARVRPEALCRGRTDVDAIALVAGPGRLHLVACTPANDLSVLQQVPGLVEHLRDGAVSGSITTPRAELSWAPDDVPAPVSALLDVELFAGTGAVGTEARIRRPASDRRAKGSDSTRLAPQDRQVIREALGVPGAEDAGQDRGDTPIAEIHPPAYRSGIEIEIVPIHPSPT